MAMTDDDIARYARHLVLKEIGGPGQQRLRAARIFIVGAGGLGSPSALYLAAAGVGQLTIADPDSVSLDNLQRQILFATGDVGASKVETAQKRLSALNPGCSVATLEHAVTPENAAALFAGHDLVLDGTDSFETRFAVNDGCYAAGVPLLSGAVGRWDGQVAIFNAGKTRDRPASDRAPCYRCLVPDLPPDAETCARVGVVGALTGVIGSIMALEAIKWITGAGQPLDGRVLFYDGLAASTRTVTLKPDPACPVCG
tara:strand:+ start:838 stop:1605 length:768 start_codon:yes stop_codon:yes gene_type:complete